MHRREPHRSPRLASSIQAGIADRDLKLRIGIGLGDVLVEESGSVHGEGIVSAMRLETLAEPGRILISDKIFREVEGKVDAAFEDAGEQKDKERIAVLSRLSCQIGLIAINPTQANARLLARRP
jgi:class 3 adenylate cyclase